MYTMSYDIAVGDYRLGMIDKVSIHRSVELLADTAVITLPGAVFNQALQVEDKLKRGDTVSISLGYEETGLEEEFVGYLQRVGTDGGNLTLHCEDSMWLFRVPVADKVLKQVTLDKLLQHILSDAGLTYKVSCTYSWTYAKFTIHNATAFDVLKKVQEECNADIYLLGDTLHLHPPGERMGEERYYDLALNVEKEELTYHRAEDKKVRVIVKAVMPDGKIKEIEVGATGGEKVTVKCATSDEASMKARGEAEVLRHSFDGYDGSITGWLIPMCRPSDSVTLQDADYGYKDGTYFVSSVETTFSREGGQRKIGLGFKLS
jgi:hypothetical protein